MTPPAEGPPAILVDGEVTLRAIGPDDWPLEQALSREPDVVRWTYYPADLDEERARARTAAAVRARAEGRVARYVVLDSDGTPLGTCGLGALHVAVPEVFYALLPQGRGRGAATRATGLLVAWAVGAGHRQVDLVTVGGNDPSEGVARRAGFTVADEHEGEHRGVAVQLRRWVRRA